jgi:hypothetical protein
MYRERRKRREKVKGKPKTGRKSIKARDLPATPALYKKMKNETEEKR